MANKNSNNILRLKTVPISDSHSESHINFNNHSKLISNFNVEKFKSGETVKHPIYGMCRISAIRGKKCTVFVLPQGNSKTKLQLRNIALSDFECVRHDSTINS
jgi:hypothetical protein